MKAWTGVLMAAVGLSLAAPAAAQLPERGARSLQLSPTGDERVGLWRMVGERTNLGVDVGVSLSRDDSGDDGPPDSSFRSFTVAPSLKRYGAPVGRFAPYLFASVPLGLERGDFGPGADQDGWTAGGALAAGLDWLPVRGVTLGAHAGVRASYYSRSFTRAGGLPDGEEDTTLFGTFGSGLSLHLYF